MYFINNLMTYQKGRCTSSWAQRAWLRECQFSADDGNVISRRKTTWGELHVPSATFTTTTPQHFRSTDTTLT